MDEVQHEHFVMGTERRKTYTDLTDFLESFDKWQNTTETLMKDKSELMERVDSLSHDKQKLVSKNDELINENSDLQSLLDSTHKSLHRICDIEGENRELRNKCDNVTAEIDRLNRTIEEKKQQHLQEFSEIQKENQNQQNELKKSLEVNIKNEKEYYEKQMQLKNTEIQDLKEKLVLADKNLEAETVRISMEYENKLAKLRQKIPSSTSQSSSSNQEIFRMKLQHMKNEYEREVRLLKERISELEENGVAPPQGPNRMTFTSNKKRRY